MSGTVASTSLYDIPPVNFPSTVTVKVGWLIYYVGDIHGFRANLSGHQPDWPAGDGNQTESKALDRFHRG